MEGQNNNAMTLKLLIDSKLNKVLFAEASKSFVDFLFYLLSLPIGTVINLLTTKSMVGSIGNIYNSFSDLNATYLQPNLQKNVLLNPKPSTSFANIPLLMGTSDNVAKKFYACNSCGSSRGVTDKCNVLCSSCNRQMTKEIPILKDSNSNICDGEGYVQGVVSYMVSDDLCVTPMSMISSISMMNKFKVCQLDMLQEKEVQVDTEEALELLKVSFKSNNVLTDVFLVKMKPPMSIR